MLYNVVLFVHILGVLIMFAAVGSTITGMIGLISSRDINVMRVWSSLTVKMDEFLPFSVILILLPGIFLVITHWGWKLYWVDLSLAILVLMTIAGPLVNLPRFKVISKTLKEHKPVVPSEEVLTLIQDKVLWNSVSIMTFEVLAIIYMMTVKPKLIGSFITVILGVILGLIFSKIVLTSFKSRHVLPVNHSIKKDLN